MLETSGISKSARACLPQIDVISICKSIDLIEVVEMTGTPKGNRTPVCAVRGRALRNRIIPTRPQVTAFVPRLFPLRSVCS